MKTTSHFFGITILFIMILSVVACEPAKNTPNTAAYTSFTASSTECTHPLEPYWQWDKDDHWHRVTCEHKEFHSPYTPHTMSEWSVTKEPTVDEEGQETRKCTVCTYPEYRSIPKLEQKPVVPQTQPEPAAVSEHTPSPDAAASHSPAAQQRPVESLLKLQSQKRTFGTTR